MLLAWPAFSQNANLRGVVLDQQTERPLAGATVAPIDETGGVLTDSSGRFTLERPASGIRVQFLGYRPVEYTDLAGIDFLEVKLVRDTLPLESVSVVAARPARVSLRAPEAFYRIPEARIELDPGFSPQNLLNEIPGVYMQSGALNTNRITIRGIGNRSPFSTTKIRAYLNDIPITNGVGETTIEDVDLSLIRSIEVRKGPTASRYGAGLGGMIHLRTRVPVQGHSAVHTELQLGEYGRRRWLAGGTLIDPKAGVQLTLQYNSTQSDGYRENNQYDREGFAALGQWQPSERHHTLFLVDFTDVKAFIPSSLNRDDYLNDPRSAADNWAAVEGFEDYDRLFFGLEHRYRWWQGRNGQTLATSLSLFSTQRENYESRPFNILRENNRAVGFRTQTTFQRPGNADLPTAAIGLEVFQEDYQWTTNQTEGGVLDTLLSDNAETRNYYNFFGEINWAFGPQWLVTAGFNYNQTRYRLEDRFPVDGVDLSGTNNFDPALSPRLSVSYEARPGVVLFGTVSHGFSTPTLEDTREADGSINTEIDPETGWNFELGSRGSWLWGRLSYDLAIYQLRVRNLLVARRLDLDQFVGVNAGKTIHNGLEARLSYLAWKAPRLQLDLAYTYADHTFDTFIDGENDFSGNDLTGSPPHQVFAGFQFGRKSGFYGRGGYRYVDAFPMNDANTDFSEAYGVVEGQVGYRLALGPLRIDGFLGVDNLFDVQYASMISVNALSFGGRAPRYYYPGLPRNWFGGVRAEWLFGS